MYSEDAKAERAYRGNQVELPVLTKHLQLMEAIVRLGNFSERLNCLAQRLVGENSPICGVGGTRGEEPSLVYALEQSPIEINNLVDRMNKQLDSITELLYG
jgi:hypothetical protein